MLRTFAPPGCLELCSAAGCTGGEERRTQGWLVSAVRTVGYRPAQSFPGVLPESDSDFHLPCLPASASSFLFHFSAVPKVRGAVLSAHRLISEPQPPLPFSYECAPLPAAWSGPGVYPGRQPQAELGFGSRSQVCTGRFLWLGMWNMFLGLCLVSRLTSKQLQGIKAVMSVQQAQQGGRGCLVPRPCEGCV